MSDAITADSPFRSWCTISRDGFVAVLRDNGANPGIFDERDAGQYWDECCGWAIDPNFILAMAWHESNFLTAGTAVETKSFGNTRAPSYGAVPIDLIAGRSGSFPAWASYLDGLASTAARLASTVWPVGAPYGQRASIREVFDHPSGQVWAPSSDANDPTSYLGSVVDSMNRWSDQASEPMAQTRAETPAVYSTYLETNYSDGRGGRQPQAVILHVTAGESAAGCLNWFANPASQVSAHYVIDRNGDIYCAVREYDTAWANGLLNDPNREIGVVDRWVSQGINPNSETISIECAGYSSEQPSGDPRYDGYTEQQFASLAFLLPALGQRHELIIDGETCFGHCEIDGVNRADCPGLSDAEWERVYAMEPLLSSGPFPTADEAYDAFCATWDDDVAWAGQIAQKGHWYGRQPQELARTVGNRLLAYDGAYAQDASGWSLDEWQEASWASGQLTIWGREPAAPPVPPEPPPAPAVGAAWPINPGDGLTGLATTITFVWGTDAPTADVSVYAETGDRVFGLDGTVATEVDVALPGPGDYEWAVRGRDGERTSDWTLARFTVAEEEEEPDTKPPKPPSTEPYPPVITANPADPSGDTWLNVHDSKVDLAVSRQWRTDCDGGAGPWPDTAQWTDPSYPGRTDPDGSWLEVRKLTRRLSMMPAITEMLLRTGTLATLPATYRVDGSPWEDAAATDYGDDWDDIPAHAQTWASQLCTLANAISLDPTLWRAFVRLGESEEHARYLATVYRCLRRRCRDLSEVTGC